MATTTATIDVRKIIEDSIEPTEPQDTILRVLRTEFEGKTISRTSHKTNARIAARLREATGLHDLGISHLGDMPRINWGPFGNQQWLILGYDPAVTINTEWIQKENASCFEALSRRNTERRQLLDNLILLDEIGETIAEYIQAKRSIDRLLQYEDLSVVRYDLERAAGLRLPKP